jgi:hypothetical protein
MRRQRLPRARRRGMLMCREHWFGCRRRISLGHHERLVGAPDAGLPGGGRGRAQLPRRLTPRRREGRLMARRCRQTEAERLRQHNEEMKLALAENVTVLEARRRWPRAACASSRLRSSGASAAAPPTLRAFNRDRLRDPADIRRRRRAPAILVGARLMRSRNLRPAPRVDHARASRPNPRARDARRRPAVPIKQVPTRGVKPKLAIVESAPRSESDDAG